MTHTEDAIGKTEMSPLSMRLQTLRRLFAALSLSSALFNLCFAANIEAPYRPSQNAATAFSPGILKALDLQVRALQPALGNPPLMASLLLHHISPDSLQPMISKTDGTAAALILKRALTEPTAYSIVQESLGGQTNQLARTISVNLTDLRGSIQTHPQTHEAFQRTFAVLEKNLLSNPSSSRLRETLDALFTGSMIHSDRAETEFAVPAENASSGQNAKITAPLTKSTPHSRTTPNTPPPPTRQVLRDHGLTEESSLYRWLHPTYIAREENGGLLIGGNPDPGTSIYGPHSQPRKMIRAKTLGVPGIAATTVESSDYGSSKDVLLKFKIRDVLQAGGQLYESDQGNLFATLPHEIPAELVRGEPPRAHYGARFHMSLAHWKGKEVSLQEWPHEPDNSFQAWVVPKRTGAKSGHTVMKISYTISENSIHFVSADGLKLNPESPLLRSVLLRILTEHPSLRNVSMPSSVPSRPVSIDSVLPAADRRRK